MKEVIFFLLVLSLLVGCVNTDETEELVVLDTEGALNITQNELNTNLDVPEIFDEEDSNNLINRKSLEKRIQEAYNKLHTLRSARILREDFPDLELVYVDKPEEKYRRFFPQEILPFRYYYSKEADLTFNICNADLTVFICKGKQDRLITMDEVDSGKCEITSLYAGDPRLRVSDRF